MKLTDNQIKEIFNSKGCFIDKIDAKGDKDYGMTSAMNRANDINMFPSFTSAYNYFKKMNWL